MKDLDVLIDGEFLEAQLRWMFLVILVSHSGLTQYTPSPHNGCELW